MAIITNILKALSRKPAQGQRKPEGTYAKLGASSRAGKRSQDEQW